VCEDSYKSSLQGFKTSFSLLAECSDKRKKQIAASNLHHTCYFVIKDGKRKATTSPLVVPCLHSLPAREAQPLHPQFRGQSRADNDDEYFEPHSLADIYDELN